MSELRGNVLCVDDEPSILRALQWVLKKHHNVSTASSGMEALELIRENDFDVIVSDQRMPGMMGCELLREALKLRPRAMRILLTGYSDMQAIVSSVNEGEVFRFLSKPWRIPELVRVVGEAVELSKHDPEGADAHEAGDSGKTAVLVIDEDDSVAKSVTEALGDAFEVLTARNIADAVAALDAPNLGVILSDTHIAGKDIRSFLKLVKNHNPLIATGVMSQRSDAQDVVELINQGQVYRFTFKPLSTGSLNLLVKAVVSKHLALKRNPELSARYRVERLSAEERKAFMETVQQQSATAAASKSEAKEGFMGRLKRGFGKLLRG